MSPTCADALSGWPTTCAPSECQNVQIFETKGHPVVFSEWMGAPGKPTVLFYGHYDVQRSIPEPVDIASIRGNDPGDNLYARGSADDKGQVFIHLKAIEAYMKNGGALPVNLKMIIEGEEEVGSENLDNFVKGHKDLLKADLVLISDSSMFAKGVPSVCYGLRGLAYMEVEVTGPNRDLHSGSFGGSVHNPIQALSEMIASLHDKNGKITIPGFYKDVRSLTKPERSSFRKLPWNDRAYSKDLGVGQLYGEKGFTTLERLWARPTLECNGIWGGYTGEGAKTVLPSKAFAKISMRIVPDQDSVKTAKLFEKHMMKIAPKAVRVQVRTLHGGEPAITPIDSPACRPRSRRWRRDLERSHSIKEKGAQFPSSFNSRRSSASTQSCSVSGCPMRTLMPRMSSST